jgi:predicted nuclease with TOPRIM domain
MLSKELTKMLLDAQQQQMAIFDKLKPLRAQEEEIIPRLNVIQQELNAVREQIAKIERDDGLADVTRTCNSLLRAGSPAAK